MSVERLLSVMQELREKCPWDQVQTPQSLTKYAIEEAYEVEEAVRSGNITEIKNELGDLLLQVVFQSQMYAEQGAFTFDDVVNALIEKMVRRHPHVFEAEKFSKLSEIDVNTLWAQIKKEERGQKQSRLSDIKHGPALNQAHDIQKNAAKVGFDFASVNDAMDKFYEELDELKEAIYLQNQQEILAEFGDCLFSLVNVGRKLNLSSEMALLQTISKFKTRFAYIEKCVEARGHELEQLSLKEMDMLWDQAKQQEKNQ